jgi:hypothetical protein
MSELDGEPGALIRRWNVARRRPPPYAVSDISAHRRVAQAARAPTKVTTQPRGKGFPPAEQDAGRLSSRCCRAPRDLFGAVSEPQLIRDGLDRVFDHADPPTAICCGRDRLAMACRGLVRPGRAGIGIMATDRMER